MASFVFPTGFAPSTPIASRTCNLLASDGTNVGSLAVSTILPLITAADLANANVITSNVFTDIITVSRASSLLAYNGTNIGATAISSVLSLITSADLANANVLTNNVQYPASFIQVHPTGNDPSTYNTYSAFNVQGTTNQTASREFLYNIGLVNNAGAVASGNAGDKVAFYAGIDCKPGGGAGWATNSVTIVEPGYSTGSEAVGTKTTYGYELDFNNNCRDMSNDFNNAAYGMAVTGSSSFTCTSAILVSGVTNSQWQRGVLLSAGITSTGYGFQDLTNSGTVLHTYSSHSVGIDFQSATFSSGAIFLPKGTPSGYISWSGSGSAVVDYVAASGNRVIGLGAGATFVNGANFSPFSNNVTSLGAPSNLWTAVYATSNVITTSNLALKEDIQQLPSVLNLIDEVDPIKFKWKTNPRRTEWGFAAQHIKAAFDKLNLGDFGGYIEEDDFIGLKNEQLIPIVWRGIQELNERIAQLENR